MNKLTIDDLSKKLNISKSKLRYYEKIKLIEGIERDETNNRVYSEKDFELINLIVCMRGLGVSIKAIKKHIEDSVINDYSLKQILHEHKKTLESKITEYKNYIQNIDNKIDNL